MQEIRDLGESLSNRRGVLVIAGAGASADSGIPTFRGGAASWWAGWLGAPVLGFFGTPFGWTWPAYERFMRRTVLAAEPNAFHRLVARLCADGKDVVVVTQNVDGLFQKAGVPADRVVEQHGTLHRNICARCSGPLIGDGYCPAYGGWPRSAAMLIGDRWFPRTDDTRAHVLGTDTTVIVAGLSGAVASFDMYIRAWTERAAPVFNINPAPNRYDREGVVAIRLRCAEAADALLELAER